MSPERQLIAIAEACGWTEIFTVNDGVMRGIPPSVAPHGSVRVPDYLNDLNACHKAVKSQDWIFSKRHQYRQHLMKIVTRDITIDEDTVMEDKWTVAAGECIEATAAQRCEAFLKDLGKWEETE
jgi:hypothetical protein